MGSVALLVAVFLSPPFMAALPQIIAALKAANYRIALDTGWPPQGWTDAVIESYAAWLGEIDTLLINEVEATALAKTEALDEAVAAYPPNDAAGRDVRREARARRRQRLAGRRKRIGIGAEGRRRGFDRCRRCVQRRLPAR